MAYCSHCGTEIGSGDESCFSCGTNRSDSGWALAVEICSCDEPTARGWRYCVACGAPTAVVTEGRSVRVASTDVQSWFDDLLPLAGEPNEESTVAATPAPGDAAEETSSASGPSPGMRSPAPTHRGVYTSAAHAAGTAQRVLLSTALATVIAAAVLWVLSGRLHDFKNGATDTFDDALAVAKLADWGTRPLVVAGIVASGWYLMRWTMIVYRNIPSFGHARLRLPASAVPWAFVVPGLNLFAPRRLINDAWRATDEHHQGGRDWLLQRGNIWTTTAWSSGVAALALHLAGWRVGSRSVDAAIAANRLAMAGYLAIGVAGAAAVMMTQRITERQEQRHAELERVAEPDPG